MTKDQERKVAAKQLLCARYTDQMKDRLRNIDERLIDYYDDMIAHSSAIEHDNDDYYNLYEILGAARFLRMLKDYEFNYRKVRTDPSCGCCPSRGQNCCRRTNLRTGVSTHQNH